MKKVILTYVCLAALINLNAAVNPSQQDTLRLNGANLDHLSEYATFWIDKTSDGSLATAINALDKFEKWEPFTSLNVGLNPHPLWLHLTVKNEATDPTRYWWSLYSHADTVIVFKNGIDGWQAIDTVLFDTPYDQRKVKVRFLASEIKLQSGETAELLMRVRNLRKPQHSFTDITTPDHNLQWEKKFFLSTGIFLGLYFMTVLLNFVLGIITRKKLFFLFSAYIVIVTLVLLQEEFLIVLYPNRDWFTFLMRFPSMGLTIIGCSMHYFIFKYAINRPINTRFQQILDGANIFGLIYGVIFTVIFFLFKEHLSFAQLGYLMMWYTSVGVISLLMIILSFSIVSAAQSKTERLVALFVACWVFYFNAAGYFLNYEGVIHYYTISYPNYFYWGLCIEFIAFGFILAWRYKETLTKNFILLTEQSKHKSELLEREIEIQERERKQIASDLHDDLGATISAIKLIISNSYADDTHLMKMVNKASKDIRVFSGSFSAVDIKDGLFNTINSRISELNALAIIKFQFIGSGEEQAIPPELKVAVFRMFSELANNILKHSKANHATVQVIIDEEQLLIMVEDDGIGFDTGKKSDGIGLENIQRRVSRFNGNLYITSDARSGTTVIITIPKL